MFHYLKWKPTKYKCLFRGAQGIIGPDGERGDIGKQGPIGEKGQKGTRICFEYSM